MTRTPTAKYLADDDTKFEWALAPNDVFSREKDLSYLARALERHTHEPGRGVQVSGDGLADGSVTTVKLGPGSVTRVKIADDAVGGPQIDTDAVGTDQLAPNAVTTTELGPGAVTAPKMGAGAALGNIGTQGIPNGSMGTGAVDNRVLAGGAALANIGGSGVTNGYLGTGAVDNRVLGAGVAGANLGYTPANKAGETNLGNFSFAPGSKIFFATENGVKVNLTGTNGEYGLEVTPSILQLNTSRYVAFHNRAAAPGDWSALFDTATHEVFFRSTVTMSALAGGVLAQIDARIAAGGGGGGGTGGTPIPPGLGCWVPSVSAIPAGWARYSILDGLIPVGAGSSFGQTFAEANSYGGSWQHQHGVPSLATSCSVSVTGSATGGPSDVTGNNSASGQSAGTGTTRADSPHTHSLNGVSLAVSASGGGTGSTAANNTGQTTWLPPMRAVVWITKS